MCKFWYDYVKPTCRIKKTKLLYMDTDSLIIHIKQKHLRRHCKRW